MKQYKDTAIVLSRVEYAERDRILTLLCKKYGKISVHAKSVRTSKSRLAGGIELLSESGVSFIEGRTSLNTLTSARLNVHFGELVKNVRRMQLAFEHLKTIKSIADEGAGQEFYPVLITSLTALNDDQWDSRLVDVWFNLHVLYLTGSAPNLDIKSGTAFDFDYDSQSFIDKREGLFSQNDIKLLRLCAGNSRPPILQKLTGAEDRLQQFSRTLLQTNVSLS